MRGNAVVAEDRGSTLLMVVFSVCVCAVVLLGAVSAASLYAAQKKLYLIADGASLAASQSFALDSVTVDGSRLSFRLTDADVRRSVLDYLRRTPGARGVQVITARAVSNDTADVTLRMRWHPPVVSLFFPSGLPIEVTSRASGAFF